MYDLNEILIQSVKERASDIHLTSGRAPSYRVDGVLAPIMGERLTPQMLEDILLPYRQKTPGGIRGNRTDRLCLRHFRGRPFSRERF